jgi:hypothetical protein
MKQKRMDPRKRKKKKAEGRGQRTSRTANTAQAG